jgi:hypothetical protein
MTTSDPAPIGTRLGQTPATDVGEKLVSSVAEQLGLLGQQATSAAAKRFEYKPPYADALSAITKQFDVLGAAGMSAMSKRLDVLGGAAISKQFDIVGAAGMSAMSKRLDVLGGAAISKQFDIVGAAGMSAMSKRFEYKFPYFEDFTRIAREVAEICDLDVDELPEIPAPRLQRATVAWCVYIAVLGVAIQIYLTLRLNYGDQLGATLDLSGISAHVIAKQAKKIAERTFDVIYPPGID